MCSIKTKEVIIIPRSTREVYDSHQEALETLDFEQLAGDYAENAIMVTIDGAFIGRDAIMKDFFQTMVTAAGGIPALQTHQSCF